MQLFSMILEASPDLFQWSMVKGWTGGSNHGSIAGPRRTWTWQSRREGEGNACVFLPELHSSNQ